VNEIVHGPLLNQCKQKFLSVQVFAIFNNNFSVLSLLIVTENEQQQELPDIRSQLRKKINIPDFKKAKITTKSETKYFQQWIMS